MSSSLPLNNNNIEGSEQYCLSPLDEWLSLYQDVIMNEGEVSNYDHNLISNVDDNDDQAHDELVEKGLETMKIVGSPNYSIRARKKVTNRRLLMNNDESGAGTSGAKKQDHNAKERIRRMKINASFLALRALLPDSTRSKKRWGAPAVVDKVVKYIPEVENEVQVLRSKKQNLQSKAKNKNEEIPKFSFNKLNQEEAVIQLCMGRQEYEEGLALMKLMQKVEDEGISISSVSALHICDTNICCHLHIQISNATFGVDYIQKLRDKIISWLN